MLYKRASETRKKNSKKIIIIIITLTQKIVVNRSMNREIEKKYQKIFVKAKGAEPIKSIV